VNVLSDRALAEKKSGLNALLLNLALIWRQHRRQEVVLTTEGSKFFEDQLLELRFGLDEVDREYGRRNQLARDLIDRFCKVLRQTLPRTVTPTQLIELGEIRDALIALRATDEREARRGVVPKAAMEGQVYQPEGRYPLGFLDDMAVPAAPAGNVVHFPRPRKRAVPVHPSEGGAA
jgi:hypothetical protein